MILLLGGAVFGSVASKQEGLWFESPGDQRLLAFEGRTFYL